jgi:hypothetical protein
VQLRCDLADGVHVDPAIFPEQRGLPVTDHHSGGCKEEGSCGSGELQL